MRKMNKIINIAIIFMLIGVGLGPNFSYSEALRVPLDTTYTRMTPLMAKESAEKTQQGTLPTITDKEYSELLGDLVHDLNNKLGTAQDYIVVLPEVLYSYLTEYSSREEILSRIYTMQAKLIYPEAENRLYIQSAEYLRKGNYSFYIRESLKKIEFYRNGCNEIYNFTFLTQEEKANLTDEQRKEIEELISYVRNSVKAAVKQIEGFEVRVAAGQQIKVINLYEWSEAHLKPMLDFYRGKIKTEVVIAPDLLLLADEYDLEQIFYNLITNSIRAIEKFHGKEMHGIYETGYGEIKITARRDNDKIIIEVKDNGIGLDSLQIRSIAREKGRLSEETISSKNKQQVLTLIFEPWFTTREGGGGQGLGIVRDDVRRYDGNINVNSEPGKGATFTISLPLAQILYINLPDSAALSSL